MKRYCKGLLIISAASVMALPAWPVAAFAYDDVSYVVGHGVGDTTSKAEERAKKNCAKKGGVAGRIFIADETGYAGWYAAALSDDHTFAFAIGAQTKHKAKRAALNGCSEFHSGCHIVDTVYNPTGNRAKHAERHRAAENTTS